MLDSDILVRLPVAVFILAFCKSVQSSRPSCALSERPCSSPYIYDEHSGLVPYVCSAPDCTPPSKSCRWRRHFSPQTRFNRFVFLNLPKLSLEVHLGLTTSPHTPFPTGYVTLPMYGRSPPLRLLPSCSKWQAFDRLPPSKFEYIPDMLKSLRHHL